MRAAPLVLVLLLVTSAVAAPPENRAQRSANLSHITGTSRKIQMFLKNRNLQILPTGEVNGTTHEFSDFTILQRITVGVGRLRIQGIATCLYLCMDSCGFLYAHKDLSEDCEFYENLEPNNYNTYSRTIAGKKTFLALDNHGRPRRLQISDDRTLGNLSGYALTLTRRVDSVATPKVCPQKHKGRLRKSPPYHRNCAKRIMKERAKKRPQKKDKHAPKKKLKQPKKRRKLDETSTMEYDSSATVSTTTENEFFRSPTAPEAVDEE